MLHREFNGAEGWRAVSLGSGEIGLHLGGVNLSTDGVFDPLSH